MKDSIDYIAYLVKRAKSENLPRPIIFLGAGASASAGIPLANQIVQDVKDKFSENPLIKEFVKNNEKDYYKVMGTLTADERRDLFYSYINDEKIKINLTNIYLAQLLKEEYVDFILTVNFDDLILRACALFNFLPPVYDISNVNVPTTSNFREKSVIYLHGQHFGKWLLNEPEELKKVSIDIANIFNEIKNKRTWIVVGYSGQDEIFNQISNLGSFTSDLFWINYKNATPEKNVLDDLINKPNTNAHIIMGYDSDSFFLDLHSKLKLETPVILNKPFSFLKGIISNVKDIEDYEKVAGHEDKYKIVKERMDISKNWIGRAVDEIENSDSVEKFKQEIIEAYLKEDFEKNAPVFLEKIKLPEFKTANIELSDFYNDWGVSLRKLANEKNDEKLYTESIEKYEIASGLNSQNADLYNNWGNSLSDKANLLGNESLFIESFEKYKIATEIDSESEDAYRNWGISIFELTKINTDVDLFKEGFEKFKKVTEINPKNEKTFNDWGAEISNLAKLKKDKELFLESIEKYNSAININSKFDSAYYNLASALLNYAMLLPVEKRREVHVEAHEKAKMAYSLNKKKSYNLACSYALLGDKENALKLLEETLINKAQNKGFVLNDPDWSSYVEDTDFKDLLTKY